MIYGYEQPVQYTPVKVFNPVTANMVLQSMGQYADAVQREYERSLQEEKEFFKEYGDFYSPVKGATEAFYNLGVGKVKDTLAKAYANGIDLTRSQEGRALISGLIRSANVGAMNQLKAQKQAAEEYNKTVQAMVANGKMTPEQAARKMQWDGVNDFQALDENGKVRMYPVAAISPFEDTNSFVERIFKDIKDTYLRMDGAFDVNGVGREKLEQALGNNLQEYLNSDGGRYAFEQFMKSNGIDISNLSNDEYNALVANKQYYNAFGNSILEQAAGKYARVQKKLNPIEELELELEKQKKMEVFRTNENIRQYKATHPNEFNPDGTPKTSTAPSVTEQSYIKDIYNTSVGKIFGTDMYTASHMIEGTKGYKNAGEHIFKQEEKILRDNKCDVNKCIKAHTSQGNIESNAKVLGLSTGGKVRVSHGNETSLNSTQVSRNNVFREIYDAADIVFNTAGYYKKSKERTDEQKQNQADIKKANYYTITDDVVGHLHKGGKYVMYVKVVGDNGSVGYISAKIQSNKKESGHSYSSKNKNHNQDLGFDMMQEASIKQRDLQATHVYTKQGEATNDGALEREAQ